METPYFICDVFTQTAFGGNQLAVLTDAQGLSSDDMQRIAKEFNFPESTFVLPAKSGGDFNVRIFTPTNEMPFAGHPNIGTAFVLNHINAPRKAQDGFVFEELAGKVPVSVDADNQYYELESPEALFLGATLTAADAAQVLSLTIDDIQTQQHLPCAVSVGMPILMIELKTPGALARANVQLAKLTEIASRGLPAILHCYVNTAPNTIHARMFAPLNGIPEDPATGGANCALAGLLATLDQAPTKDFEWQITQGVQMGRPSLLTAKASKLNDRVISCKVGGHAVLISKGTLFI